MNWIWDPQNRLQRAAGDLVIVACVAALAAVLLWAFGYNP